MGAALSLVNAGNWLKKPEENMTDKKMTVSLSVMVFSRIQLF
jgi:hypothetical protein